VVNVRWHFSHMTSKLCSAIAVRSVFASVQAWLCLMCVAKAPGESAVSSQSGTGQVRMLFACRFSL